MSPTTTQDALPPDLLDHLLNTIIAAIPAAPDDTDHTRAAHRETARLALLALQPQNAFQAMLAAQAIAAHHAVMDNLRRAAQPDLAPSMAARLRANAASVARVMQATIRSLQKQQPPADAPRPAAQPRTRRAPAATPTRLLAPTTPQPAEITDPEHAPPSRPYRRWEDMTLAERRAHYGYQGDPSFQANGALV
jgi:hypothetical protein